MKSSVCYCLLLVVALASVTLAQEDESVPKRSCNPDFTQKVNESFNECRAVFGESHHRRPGPPASPESALVSSLLSRYRRDTEEDAMEPIESQENKPKDERHNAMIAMHQCMEERLQNETDFIIIKKDCTEDFYCKWSQNFCLGTRVFQCIGFGEDKCGHHHGGKGRGRGHGHENGGAPDPAVAPAASVFLY